MLDIRIPFEDGNRLHTAPMEAGIEMLWLMMRLVTLMNSVNRDVQEWTMSRRMAIAYSLSLAFFASCKGRTCNSALRNANAEAITSF